MTQTHADVPLERFGGARGAHTPSSTAPSARRAIRSSRRRAQDRDAPLEGAHPRLVARRCRRPPRTRSPGGSWTRCRSKGAELLGPVFDAHKRPERPAVDPDRSAVSTAIRRDRAPGRALRRLAPNMLVKIPATSAGIAGHRRGDDRGISINATVCFTLPQCVAVAEAVERGLGGASAKATTSAPWGRSARSWSAGWTTG